MPKKTLQNSFAGGEIADELAGRSDLAKYSSGLSLCRNFIALPHGPVDRRPGFQFINEGGDSTRKVRLAPFQFSATESVVLEFGHQYIRFHSLGETIVDAVPLSITAITNANPGVVTYTGADPATGDWFLLAGIGGMTALNGRWVRAGSVNIGAKTFQLLDLWGTHISTVGMPAYGGSGTASHPHTIASPYTENHLHELVMAQSADVVTITHPSYASRELKRLAAADWTLTTVSFSPALSAPTGVAADRTHTGGTGGRPYTYCVTAVDADGVTESLASAQASALENALGHEDNFNTVSWDAVAGASRYYIYKKRGGGFGYMGQTTGLEAIDDNILADTMQSPPESNYTLNTGVGDYPAACTYHEQRRWFAGTVDAPQTIWATRVGTHSNLTSSTPSRDADGMELTISAAQFNQIRHLVPFGDLIAFTVAGEWRLFSDSAPSITPTSVTSKPQSYAGAGAAAPVVTPSSILYAQASGAHIRELTFSEKSGGYQSTDMSIMAPHRFDGHSIAQIAFSRAPDAILWAVRGDGKLLGMSYVPDQQVFAWHAHDTDGYFESCCVVTESGEDRLYVVVRRTVNGRTARYIERLAPRLFGGPSDTGAPVALEDAFFLDAAMTYGGTPATTITGLYHLEGKEVAILADGAVVARKTVTAGAITLDAAASVVHIGLPYTSSVGTLPLVIVSRDVFAGGAGVTKNISAVYVRVKASNVVQAGPSLSRLREYPARQVSDNYGSPPALVTRELTLKIDPSWDPDGKVYVTQESPLPLMIVSLAAEVQTGG